MRIAYIVGTAVATMKDDKLRGHRLLLAQDADLDGSAHGRPFVAVDTVDVEEASEVERVDMGVDMEEGEVVMAMENRFSVLTFVISFKLVGKF